MIDLKHLFVMREDLYAFDGTIIVKQGEIITPGILGEIQRKSPGSESYETLLLGKTELAEDLSCVMNEEKYRIIFDRQGLKDDLLSLLGTIPLTPDILQELSFFKIKDYYTYRHILVTTIMTARMVGDVYKDESKALLAASTALTHDFGKSRIPIEILQSTRKLTYEEYTYILEHPWIGFLLLSYYTGKCDTPPSLVAFNHHEKIDGSGYPRRVRVDDPITQFVTINDMFDALISHRPYRVEPFNVRGAIDYICDQAELGKLNMTGVKLLIAYNRHTKSPIDDLIFSHDHLGYRPPDELNNYSGLEDYYNPDLDQNGQSSE